MSLSMLNGMLNSVERRLLNKDGIHKISKVIFFGGREEARVEKALREKNAGFAIRKNVCLGFCHIKHFYVKQFSFSFPFLFPLKNFLCEQKN